MRGLVWFVLGFGMATGLCSYGLPTVGIMILLLTAAIGLALSLKYRKKLKLLTLAAVVFAGCFAGGCGFLGFRGFYLNTAIDMDGKTEQATIHVSDYSYGTAYGSAVDGYVILDGKPYQIRVYINETFDLSPGDQITGRFRFRVTTPDGQQDATYHPGKGIFLLGYQRGHGEITHYDIPPWWTFPARMRNGIRLIIQSSFSEDTYGFAQALLIGDGSALDYETDTAFKLSGIRHIIAVSGLHVSILYGLLSVITAKKRFLTVLLGLPLMLLFAAVAGFTPSVVRACIMVGLMIIAMAFDREYDPATALAFACLVMMLINPLVITAVGFQLSVASVAGILLFYSEINGWLSGYLVRGKGITEKVGMWFSSSIAVTLSAMILTTPLSACYFGAVSLVGPLTNLLTLWIISFIFYGIILVCLLGLFWTSGAAFAASIIGWPIRYVLGVSKFLGGLPLAAVYTRSGYIAAWLVFVYVLLIVFLISREKKPWMLSCCAVLGLLLALLASWTEPLLNECRMTVLDVGQGQSILLQSEGRTYLVDCGGDRDNETADIVAETLLSQGVTRLDGIIVTHFDRDHSGGLPMLLTRISSDSLFIPRTDNTEQPEWIMQMDEGTVVSVSDNMELRFGSGKITIIGPTFSADDNENSLCILFQTENCDILITGDRSDAGERMLLRQAQLPQVDVLIAGHHGSKYSTSWELLQAVKPEMVIISAGEDNPYGHPAPELLDRLTQTGCYIYRTDQNGTIVFRR